MLEMESADRGRAYLFLAMQEGRSSTLEEDSCVIQSPVERPAKYHLISRIYK